MKSRALHLKEDGESLIWLRERHDRVYLAALIVGEIAAVGLAILSFGLWAVVANSLAVIALAVLVLSNPPPGKLSRDLRAEARGIFMGYARHTANTNQWLGPLKEYSPLLFDCEVAWRAGDLLDVKMDEKYHRAEIEIDYSRVAIANEFGERVYPTPISADICWTSEFVRRDSSRHLYIIVFGDNNTLRVFPSGSVIRIYDRSGTLVNEMWGELEDWGSRSDLRMTRYLFSNITR